VAKKQTQAEKKIAQINAARQAGNLTQAQAQMARQAVKNNSNASGNVNKSGETLVRDILNNSKSNNTGGGNNFRPDDPDRFPDGGPIKGPPDVDPPDDIAGGTPPVYSNKPMPTGSAGEGMQWSPVYTTDADGRQWITDWVAIPIPGYEKPTEPGEEKGNSAKDREGAKKRLEQLLRTYGVIDDSENGQEFLAFLNGLVERWGANNEQTIMSELREHRAYKERFKGNQDRIKNGYGAMSEAEYITVESDIRKKMRAFGLDDAFYTNGRIAGLIGGDVSSDEVADRLTKAKKIVDSADGNIKSSLTSLYGASMGDLIGYVLDPALASEGLTRKINAGIAYGVAKGNNLNLDRGLSEQIGELTYGDERTARQTLGQAGIMADSVRRLRNIDDENITDADVVESQFGLDAESGTRIKKMQSRERARFSGSSGAFGGTLQGNNF
jgi:hypothetical protein